MEESLLFVLLSQGLKLLVSYLLALIVLPLSLGLRGLALFCSSVCEEVYETFGLTACVFLPAHCNCQWLLLCSPVSTAELALSLSEFPPLLYLQISIHCHFQKLMFASLSKGLLVGLLIPSVQSVDRIQFSSEQVCLGVNRFKHYAGLLNHMEQGTAFAAFGLAHNKI